MSIRSQISLVAVLVAHDQQIAINSRADVLSEVLAALSDRYENRTKQERIA